jgi:hypothetical protein
VGHEVAISNPLVPWGVAWFYWNGTKYQISPEQDLIAIYKADGTALADGVATGLTLGTGYELWSSTGLVPDWMLQNGSNFQTLAVVGATDPSSVAPVTVGVRIADAPYTGAIDGNNFLSSVGAMIPATWYKGPSQGFCSYHVRAGSIKGPPTGILNFGSEVERTIVSVGATATRKVRMSFAAGAVTNRFTLWSFTMKSGVC